MYPEDSNDQIPKIMTVIEVKKRKICKESEEFKDKLFITQKK